MKEVALGAISQINPPKAKSLDHGAECSFVPMDHVDDQFGRIAALSVRMVSEVEKGYTCFQDGDVLFAKITPCMENGKCAIARNLVNGIGFGSTEFHVVRPREAVISAWIYYYLRQQTVRDRAEKSMTGSAGQRRVPAPFLAELALPLPSPSEQRRIAGILARADRLRRLRRVARELGDGYLQSVFIEMFGDPASNPMGWKYSTLAGIKTKFSYGTSAKCTEEPVGLPVLRIPNVIDQDLDLSDLKYAELSQGEVAKLTLAPGDLLFVRTNGNPDYVGRCAIFDLPEHFLCASYLIRARLDCDRVDPWFLTTYLHLPAGRQAMFPYIRTTAGQSNIGKEGLGQIPVPLPPLPLQQRFAAVVRRYERVRAGQREAERQAEALFQALLHRAFAGEL